MPAADETFFLNSGDEFPIAEEAGGGIVIEAGNTKDVQLNPRVEKGDDGCGSDVVDQESENRQNNQHRRNEVEFMLAYQRQHLH